MAISFSNLLVNLRIFTVDFWLMLYGLLTPSLNAKRVVPKGCPGYQGQWPEYKKREEGQSRCSCPAINAMANHGILPHDGKNISFIQLGKACRTTYNFGSTFCEFVPRFAANYLNRDYKTGHFDLHELDVRNPASIEHDASLVRKDLRYEPDQSIIATDLVEQLLKEATGTDKTQSPVLTPNDLARFLARRRAQSSIENEGAKSTLPHLMFGQANASTMLAIFGGRVADLEPFLLEERIPSGWQSYARQRAGLTLALFNVTVFPVGLKAKKLEPLERQAIIDKAAPTK